MDRKEKVYYEIVSLSSKQLLTNMIKKDVVFGIFFLLNIKEQKYVDSENVVCLVNDCSI